jgi:uncharacterized protein YeaO (DUF488 family)
MIPPGKKPGRWRERNAKQKRRPITTKKNSITIRVKRAYEKLEQADGTRILVDRLWPRGLTKDKAAIDLWLKELAPSTDLRKWFGHDPKKWRTFCRRYRTELKQHSAPLQLINSKAKERVVTLIYGARDQEHNGAVVLQELLTKR